MNGEEPAYADAGAAVASQFDEAARLLAEPDSPDAFARGAALLDHAARAGHAEAICRLATIEAIGAGRPRNWERALDLLADAATRGSESAREQLRLLSGASGDDWAALRSAIKLETLIAIPERESLSETPRLRVMRGFASVAECAWIIRHARRKLAPAMIWDMETGRGRPDPARSNRAVELRVTDLDLVFAVVRARISAATRLPEPVFEPPQVMHYAVGQEFKPHFDFLDPKHSGHTADLARRGQRIATFLIYLNEDFEGGETEFPQAGISWRGRTGDAFFFANVGHDGAPDPLTLHAGRPPSSGEKWIFSQWIRDRSPAAPG